MLDIAATSVLEAWIIVVCITNLISLIQLYGLYRFYTYRWTLIVQKRYPKLVMFEAILVITLLSIIFPFWSLAGINQTKYAIWDPQVVTDAIGEIMWPALTHLIAIIEATRLYLICYDLHFLASSKQNKWKSQIDSRFAAKNWYLQNKKTYGNERYIVKRAMCYYLFTICIVLLTWQFYRPIGFYVEAVFYFVFVSFIVLLSVKCKHCKHLDDNFFFFYEFNLTILSWSFCFFAFCIWVILVFLDEFVSASFVVVINTVFAFTMPSLLSTLWITRKISRSQEWRRSIAKSRTGMVGNRNSNSESAISKKEKTLSKVLENESKFEEFMDWMLREFCSESALCFIELAQFKKCLVGVIDPQQDNDYNYIGLLYDDIPKSSIVYDNMKHQENSADSFKMIARLLYIKYIAYGAEFEVNISSNLRNKYVAYNEMDYDMPMEVLVNAFDDILLEVFIWMRRSFDRFQIRDDLSAFLV